MDLRVLLLACLCLVVRVNGQTKAYGEACSGTGVGDCIPNTHLKCDTTCKCEDNYVRDTGAQGGAACKLKVGQTCTNPDATVCVSHTTCPNTNKCTCITTGYKPGTVNDLGLCVETYDSACATATATADCTNSLAHSTCTNSMCKCANGYKVNTATPKECTGIIGMTCTANTDCNVMGVSNAECTGTQSKACKCMNGYYGATCMKIIGEKVCTDDANCNSGTNALKHSRCSAGKCECLATAIQQDNICKLKVDQTCTANTDCPTNAECTGTPTTKCTCKANYTPKNGMCEVENAGMTVKISMMLMVAALISVLIH